MKKDGFFPKNPKDPDDAVLETMKRVGADLKKPHKIEFFLYFPTEELAGRAAAQVEEHGFEAEVQPAAQGTSWLCFATKEMVPDHRTLSAIRTRFERITKSLRGEYDGWGALTEP